LRIGYLPGGIKGGLRAGNQEGQAVMNDVSGTIAVTSSAVIIPLLEGVYDFDTRFLKISPVACRDREAMHESSGRNQTVLDRHAGSGCTKVGKQLSPAKPGICIPGRALDPLHSGREPSLEAATALAPRQQEDPEAKFAEDHGVHREIEFVLS
jgi:hypothetical protein